MKYIKINKNRGWRGLAEVEVISKDRETMMTQIFSFSQEVWDDLINKNIIVVKDNEYYYVIHFTSVIRGLLPRPDQQRSVLIKNFIAEIDHTDQVPINEWNLTIGTTWSAINHFNKNKNNHTQSDWNCIGIRVVPSI